MRENDRDQVKELLKARIEDLCAKLLPSGRRQGRLWVAHNPVTGDYKQSPEFKVALTGDHGAWKDWRSGEKGDVFLLIAYVHGHTSFRDTMAWARDFLGLATMRPEERRRLEADARKASKERDEQAEKVRLAKIAGAEQKFLDGAMLGARSVAEQHARRYFALRHCGLDLVPAIDEATFRFSDASEYWTKAEFGTDRGRRWKIKDGPVYPAIHSAMRTATGQVTACHVTFLDPAEPKKIDLGKDHHSKMIFGPAKGGVIRICHGPEGKPPELAREAHPVIVCEGVETGLSLAIALGHQARVWAAGSLSNMANAPVWLDCVSVVIVARDNNEGNRQAEKQLHGVLEALGGFDKPLTVMASHVGDDFNDLIQEDDDE